MNSGRQSDYLVTIFSRHKGKTRSFYLGRRFLFLTLGLLILLVVSLFFLGQAFFEERGERQRLQERVALLDQMMSEFEEDSQKQGGPLPEIVVTPAVEPEERAEPIPEKKDVVAEPPASEARNTTFTANVQESLQSPAKIDDAKVAPLDDEREGFRFDFKLVNLVGEPISGNVAIIASLRPPHQPRFVSFPSMQLVEGMPVKLRKSVGFNIRYFKYVTGRFYFPFNYSESFRILVYNQDEELILDATLPAEEVTAHGLLSEEPAPSGTPFDPSLSS
jgi:hypothetical protein